MRAFLRGFGHAFRGIAHVVRTQRNARVHLAVAVAVVAAGILFRVSAVEWALLALTMGMVFGAEMINTAVEQAVDLATPAFDRRAKVAKDVSAGAVLITALAAIAVGIAIFGPPLLGLIAR